MPWSPQQAERFKKGLSSKQKNKWSHVANSALQRGNSKASAVKQANAVSKGAIERRMKGRSN